MEELVAVGHQVTVLCPGQPAPPNQSDAARQPEAASGPMSGTWSTIHITAGTLFGSPGAWPRILARPWRLFYLIQSSIDVARARKNLLDVDQIVAHWLFPSGLPWAWFLLRPGAKLTVVVHGSDLRLLLRLPSPLINGTLLALRKTGASLRFVSEALKAQLLECRLHRAAQALVAAAEVRSSPLETKTSCSKAEARANTGVAPQRRLVVIVGRLITQKRAQTALAAASLIPGSYVVVIGDGPERLDLQQKFPDVHFLGELPRPRALDWLNAADLLITASRWEGAPTVVREALALRTIVVSPRISDLHHWSRANDELWLVD